MRIAKKSKIHAKEMKRYFKNIYKSPVMWYTNIVVSTNIRYKKYIRKSI